MSKEAEGGGISRRNLIKGAGVVGAASLVAGLMGCASPFQPSAGEAGGASGPASGAQGGTGGSGPFDRNPQTSPSRTSPAIAPRCSSPSPSAASRPGTAS